MYREDLIFITTADTRQRRTRTPLKHCKSIHRYATIINISLIGLFLVTCKGSHYWFEWLVMLHYVTNVPLCHIHRIEWACLPFNHNPSLVVSRWISSGISMCAVRVCVCVYGLSHLRWYSGNITCKQRLGIACMMTLYIHYSLLLSYLFIHSLLSSLVTVAGRISSKCWANIAFSS